MNCLNVTNKGKSYTLGACFHTAANGKLRWLTRDDPWLLLSHPKRIGNSPPLPCIWNLLHEVFIRVFKHSCGAVFSHSHKSRREICLQLTTVLILTSTDLTLSDTSQIQYAISKMEQLSLAIGSYSPFRFVVSTPSQKRKS